MIEHLHLTGLGHSMLPHRRDAPGNNVPPHSGAAPPAVVMDNRAEGPRLPDQQTLRSLNDEPACTFRVPAGSLTRTTAGIDLG